MDPSKLNELKLKKRRNILKDRRRKKRAEETSSTEALVVSVENCNISRCLNRTDHWALLDLLHKIHTGTLEAAQVDGPPEQIHLVDHLGPTGTFCPVG